MTIVGFDTSTAATSACVLRGDGEAFEHIPAPQRLLEPPGHSRELMPAVADLMERAGVGWGDVTAIAVGVGPGTFTGLRIGVATARALATAAKVPVHPVSSLAALAAGIGEPLALPLIDAKRGELFGALFEDGKQVVEPFVTRPENLEERAGRDLASAVAAGDGSLRFRQFLEAAGVRVPPDDSQLHVVRALHTCRLAARVPPERPEAVLPTYIRDPDAEPIP
ncbi:MAG: tRNA threonylcarbamoyladenosine biosynthesis protein TsaB [Thermoleophilaceae bacterium]|jgi:tRNA threonylcarbamoyladenosine biosynthesis protein TsaB|nr:tRNA threonylcarbamoyladenosine biosynthesis protein TsaB [Thermoleophilaceae bacterium]